MKQSFKYTTYDGALHDTPKAALQHLDKRYTELLCKVARDVLNLGYVQATEYINDKLDLFIELQSIKDDKAIETEGSY
jgi:hypothetical protein